jgi:hypothetical protein
LPFTGDPPGVARIKAPHLLGLSLMLGLLSFTAGPAAASPRGVGLGVAGGFALPHGPLRFDPALSWGFYVDIPLLDTFHITPSTLVYRLDPKGGGGAPATDVSLSFKFMIPLGPLEGFAGVTAGITSTSRTDPHVGVLAGAQLRVLPNVDVFGQVNYRVVLQGDSSLKDVMLYVGPIFRF